MKQRFLADRWLKLPLIEPDASRRWGGGKAQAVVIGVLRLTLFLSESGSLKGKRRILRSIKDRLRSQFNVSVAEVGFQDLWQKSEIAVALAATDREYADKVLQTILGKMDSWRLAEIVDVEMEII